MNIRVNGSERAIDENAPLLSLLEQLGLKPQSTVVERNGAIVPREAYGTTVLEHGDELELVRFVGGG